MNRLKRAFLVAMQVLVIVIGLAGPAGAPEAGQFCNPSAGVFGTASNGRAVYCSSFAHGAWRWTY